MGVVRSTARELSAQSQLSLQLAEEGYATFSRLLDLYTLILTKDPNCIGYTTPDGIICLNEGLTLDGMSFVCRHEILHQWMNHHQRFLDYAAKKVGLDPKNLTPADTDRVVQMVYGDPRRLDNMAKDWDMSRHYTREDKLLAKHLECSGRICEGLVLELDRPDLMDLTAEEIWDKLIEEEGELPQPPQNPEEGEGQEGQGQEGQGQEGQGQEGEGQEGQGSSGSSSSSSKGKMQNKKGSSGSGSGEGQEGEEGEEGQEGRGIASKGNKGPESNSKSFKGSMPGSKQDNGQPQKGKSPSSRSEEGGTGGGETEYDPTLGRGVMIGDKGNSDIQQQEQEAREAQVQKDVDRGKLQNLSEEELEKQRDLKIKELNSKLNSSATKDAGQMEINAKRRTEVERQRKRKERSQANYDMETFEDFRRDVESWCRTVKNEASARSRSWSRMDRKNHSPQIMKKGKKNTPSGEVPVVNVYMDCSGSCTFAHEKILEVGQMFKDLDAMGLCIYNEFYFAITKGTDPNRVGGGNSWGGADLAQDLYDTGSENVVVVTDGDTNSLPYATNPVPVDNAWFICVNGRKPTGMIASICAAPQNIKYYELSQ